MDRFVNKKIEKQTIYEIYRACRLCGAGGGYKMPIIQNVVNLDGCDVELKQKIRECVQIEVHHDDKMPPLICELCVDKVNDFYEFLEMCKQTNKRTRLKLGLPPQMLPRGAPDAGDCILGVTEPIYINDEDSNEPLSDKKSKTKGVKIKKEPEKQHRELRIKLKDKISPRESRSSRNRQPTSPRLRTEKRPEKENVSFSRLQSKMKKSRSPPPKSILKKETHRKPEVIHQSSESRLKRTRESEMKSGIPTKKVKISLPSRTQKISPRNVSSKLRRLEVKKRTRQVDMKPYKQSEKSGKGTQAQCFVCGACFKTPQAMVSHRRSHVVTFTNPQLACNPCELWFSSVEEANAHQRRHNRLSLKYRCRCCTRSYTKLQTYKEHLEKYNCLQWEEVPDVKCSTCWKMFPTQNLLDHHRCAGVWARPRKCSNCGKNFATRKSLMGHMKSCRKVYIAPELLARLMPLQVRMAKCDSLLANMKQGHYDVSTVNPNFGLVKNCIYPYIASGLRIKSEPSDCMVKINDLDFGSYVHWDSEDEAGDSETENLDVSVFTNKRKVDSLVALSLKIIFSNKFLGKVPRKFRRVKIETIINSALNDSWSDLSINDDVSVSDKGVTVSDDKHYDSDKKIDDNGIDDLFPKVDRVDIVRSDDFDSLFNDNNVIIDSDKSAAISDDILLVKNSINVCGNLVSGAKENLNRESKEIVDNKSSKSTNENIEQSIVECMSTNSAILSKISQRDDALNDTEQKIYEKFDLNNHLETSVRETNQNININFNGNQQDDMKKIQDSLISDDSKTTDYSESTENIHPLGNNHALNQESTTNNTTEKTDTQKVENIITLKDLVKCFKQNKENDNEDNFTEPNAYKNLVTNTKVDETRKKVIDPTKSKVIGDADIDNEIDDKNLMAELDAQIGDKRPEVVEKQMEIDGQDTEKVVLENEKYILNKQEEMSMKETESLSDALSDKRREVSAESAKKYNDDDDDDKTETGDKQNKITLEDLLPKEVTKPLDLDNISDDEFDLND